MRRILVGILLAAATPALANDSTAELGTGGLVLARTDMITMESEDLSISTERVTVDYTFINRSEEDIETIVAFPMPDIENNEFGNVAIPQNTEDNFLGFEVIADGKDIAPELEHKAIAVGIDVTKDLEKHGVPLFPFGEDAYAALKKLPPEVVKDWQERGIIWVNGYDDGTGFKQEITPFWRLRSTYWWKMTFPSNKPIKVSHRYLPSVGGSAGLSFFLGGKFEGTQYELYKAKYCMDADFERTIQKIAKLSPDGYPLLTETRLSYVLTSGGNWALGTIGKFKLTIDKGDPKNIVSFCGQGVKKTGPTTFEVSATDYYPERDVDILILQPYSMDGLEPATAEKPAGAEAPAAEGVQ